MEAAEGHAHEHEYIDIAESHTVSAYGELFHDIVSLQFNIRGIDLSLTYEEALELAGVMEGVKDHCERRGIQAA